MALTKEQQRRNRKTRIRKKVEGNKARPRLTVFRSLHHVYAQLVDDLTGKTMVQASSLDMNFKSGNKQAAERVGALVAERAKSLQVTKVCFDRNGYLFHGVVQALADAARKAGLEF